MYCSVPGIVFKIKPCYDGGRKEVLYERKETNFSCR